MPRSGLAKLFPVSAWVTSYTWMADELQFRCSLCGSLMTVEGNVKGLVQMLHVNSLPCDADDPRDCGSTTSAATWSSRTVLSSSTSSPILNAESHERLTPEARCQL